jgi:hypothetical protein
MPSEQVLSEFESVGPLVPLPGGRGTAWRAGDVVLKPLDLLADEVGWLHTVARETCGDDLARRPVCEPSGIVHGDLAPNVLLDDALAPAVIDLTVYWRPVRYAVAVDAVCFEGAPASLLGASARRLTRAGRSGAAGGSGGE